MYHNFSTLPKSDLKRNNENICATAVESLLYYVLRPFKLKGKTVKNVIW